MTTALRLSAARVPAAAGARRASKRAPFPSTSRHLTSRILGRRRASLVRNDFERAADDGLGAVCGQAAPESSAASRIDEVMRRVRLAMRIDAGAEGEPSSSTSGLVWGVGQNLGMPVRWCMRHDGGSFSEETIGPELSYVSAHAEGSMDVWETDHSGYTQSLQLDDHEAALLAGWARTGWWARAGAGEVLHLEVEGGGGEEEEEAGGEVVVTMRIRKGGLVTARMRVSVDTWLPARMEMKVCGDDEVWLYEDWQHPTDRRLPPHPAVTTLKGSTGGTQIFRVEGVRANAGVSDAWYAKPTGGILENGGLVRFDARETAEARVEKAASSHVLVRPKIDGKDVGPFILDTGASGMVISTQAAEKLGLRPFGEVFVSGVAGKVPSRFRRANELTLGPITMDRPVFMEMDVGGIVSGSAEPVAGIVGFDAFKSAIVEVGPGGFPVRFFDPATFEAPESWTWLPLLMVSNVPHVAADVAGIAEPQIFMIDSGAGGADCIFHARAVEELNLRRLLPPGKSRASSRVRGVGGSSGESSGATRAYRGRLEWISLRSKLPGDSWGGGGGSAYAAAAANVETTGGDAGTLVAEDPHGSGGGRFVDLNVLLASDNGFDLSEHSCGLICANALNTRRVVYDVPNRRVALLVDGVDERVPAGGVM